MSLSGVTAAPLVPAPSALDDAMALLAVCSDPAATMARLATIADAVTAGEAALQKRSDELAAERDARSKALDDREAALKTAEAELKAKVGMLSKAIAENSN